MVNEGALRNRSSFFIVGTQVWELKDENGKLRVEEVK